MTCDYQLLPHEGIQSLSPYIPGKSAEQVANEQGLTNIIKLASNENPLGCSPLVTKALSALTPKQICTYPTSAHDPLRWKLAQKLAIDVEMLTLTNGSDALFPLLLICFALYSDKHILTHKHAFMTYGIQAKTLGIPVTITPLLPDWNVDIDAMIDACTEKTALIFIANPNNPTGLLISQSEILRLLQHIPETTILVLDEAYYEYIADTDKPRTIPLLARYSNLVITRTFSKAYGLAGLRLGYAITNPAITSIMQRVLLPFTVNKAALVAGSAALEDDDFIRQSVSNNINGLKQMQQGLAKLTFPQLPSACNFITFDYKKDTIPIYQSLQEHGIIVRPLHPYGLTNYLRVTIGTAEQNTRFLDTLEELQHEK